MDKAIHLAQFYGKSQNYTTIAKDLFKKYNVKRGLRNEDKTGVLIGLTRVADVVGYKVDDDGHKVDADGELFYRGINVMDLVNSACRRKTTFGATVKASRKATNGPKAASKRTCCTIRARTS